MKKQIPPKLSKLYHSIEKQVKVLRVIKLEKRFIKDVKYVKLRIAYSKTNI